MSGELSNSEQPITDMKVRMFHFLIMNGLGVVVLAAWNYTLHITNQKQAERIDQIIQVNQAQTEKLTGVLTEIKQYMEDQKYQNRIQTIRSK